MRRPIPTTLAAALLACAGARPAAPPPSLPPPAATAAAAPAVAGIAAAPPRVSIGGDAASVRKAFGDPLKVERIDSAAAPGTRYERWIYPGGREVVLVDGKVADVLP